MTTEKMVVRIPSANPKRKEAIIMAKKNKKKKTLLVPVLSATNAKLQPTSIQCANLNSKKQLAELFFKIFAQTQTLEPGNLFAHQIR